MRITTPFFRTLLASIAASLVTVPASAATITFSNFQHAGSDPVDYIVTVADDTEAGVTAGRFQITYRVDPASTFTTTKLTGFFFDVADPFAPDNSPYNAGNLGLTNESLPLSCGQGFNTDQVVAGGGCNTNINLGAGAGAFQNHQFDVAIAWKNGNDLSDGTIGMFEIADIGLTVDDWVAVGLRGQGTGPVGGDVFGGSAKEFAVVPVPAAVWLFGSGLLGLVAVARRRRA